MIISSIGTVSFQPPHNDKYKHTDTEIENSNKYCLFLTGEYIQRPLLEEFLQDVLADLNANNDQVVSVFVFTSFLIWLPKNCGGKRFLLQSSFLHGLIRALSAYPT